MERKRTVGDSVLLYFLVAIVVIFFFYPILYIILTSIKSPLDIYAIPPKLFFFEPTFNAWTHAFTQKPLFYYFFNSIVVAFGTTLVSMLFGTLSAYALARFRIKGAGEISFFIFMIRMFPPFAAALPFFLFMKNFSLLDTRLGLIMAHTTFNLPFVVWMMREFIIALPRELEEAGMVDGLARMQAFRKLLLPLLKPSLVAVSIFCIIFSWSEFLLALVLTGTEAKTMPVAIAEFPWQEASAAGTALILPVLLFSFCVQKYLVRSLSYGAINE